MAIACVCEAVRLVLGSRAWGRAFDETCLGALHGRLGTRVLTDLNIVDLCPAAVVQSSKPPPIILLQCFLYLFRVEVGFIHFS